MSSDAFNPKLLLSSLFLTGYLACMTPGFATEAPQTPTEQEAALLLAADAEANKRFNEAWQAYRKGRIATLENLGATLEAHPLGDYPKLWQLLLEFRRNKDDPDTNLRFIKFIERHQGQYLGEQSASDYLMTAADRINPVLFNRLYSLLQWNQEEPDILAWHHWYNFETTPRKTIEARLGKDSDRDPEQSAALVQEERQELRQASRTCADLLHHAYARHRLQDVAEARRKALSQALL